MLEKPGTQNTVAREKHGKQRELSDYWKSILLILLKKKKKKNNKGWRKKRQKYWLKYKCQQKSLHSTESYIKGFKKKKESNAVS